MTPDININVTKDTISPTLDAMQGAAHFAAQKRSVGQACRELTRSWVQSLPPNKRGWPTSGFYQAAARTAAYVDTESGIEVSIDHPSKPGAMRQRYHGGAIDAKDHLLTIPARQEFYNRRATDFTNLRLVVFASGTMALVVGKGGLGQVNFSTGRERGVTGAGVRSQAMVAYWLRDHVDQDADPSVLPPDEAYQDAAVAALGQVHDNLVRGGGSA